MEKKDNNIAPQWLRELQLKSWEPEIILSGLVLFAMFNLPEKINQLEIFINLNIYNSGDLDNVFALLKVGIYWLILGLILHLVSRAIWVGLLGLSSAFPGGIQYHKIKAHGKLRERIEKIPSFENIILRLENICSSIFSFTFFLFMSLLGGYLYIFMMILVPITVFGHLIGQDIEELFITVPWIITVLIIGLLALIDFITLGYFRRFKWISKIFAPFHQVIGWVTLSRLYRPIYYGMVTNLNRWGLFLFLFLFSAISILATGELASSSASDQPYSNIENWSNAMGYEAFSGYYDNLNQKNPSIRAHIQSDMITDNVLRLFVVASIDMDEEMEANAPMDSLRKAYPDEDDPFLYQLKVQDFLKISIDNEPVAIERWLFHFKEELGMQGYLGYISLSDFPEGLHELAVQGTPAKRNPMARIPFFKAVE